MAKKRKASPSYYHGGFGGLSVGDWVDPSAASANALRSRYEKYDSAYVFVTTSKKLATAYAHQYARLMPAGPGGAVYEVNMKGPKEIDEDFAELAPLHGEPFSFRAKQKLQIRSVTLVAADENCEYQLFAPFETWESNDGNIYPMWDEEGFVLPNPRDAANGLTKEILEERFKLGPFPGKDALIVVGLYIS